jgi:hypothetical protein
MAAEKTGTQDGGEWILTRKSWELRRKTRKGGLREAGKGEDKEVLGRQTESRERNKEGGN